MAATAHRDGLVPGSCPAGIGLFLVENIAAANVNLITACYDGTLLGRDRLAVYRLLQSAAFDDHAVNVLTTAYEAALRELRLIDRADPCTEIIARKILECADAGECDPKRLCELALKDIQG